MAKTKRRGQSVNATGRSTGGQRFVKLDHTLLSSEAWQALSPDATKVLLDLWNRHNGSNNGFIGYSQRAAYECLCRAHSRTVTRTRATKALREIQDKGFVVMVRASSFNQKTKEAREWRLTIERQNDDQPTREFKHWRADPIIQNTGTQRVPDGHPESACDVPECPADGSDKHPKSACIGVQEVDHRHRESATYNIPGDSLPSNPNPQPHSNRATAMNDRCALPSSPPVTKGH